MAENEERNEINSVNETPVVDSSTQVVSKKKKWIIPVIVGSAAAVLIIAAAVLAYVLIVAAPKKALQKHLDLGDKYLSEMDYENALLAYEEAIKINPKDERAYLKIAHVYDILSDLDLEEHNNREAIAHLDQGISVLEKGITQTDSEEMKERKQELEDKKSNIKDDDSNENTGGGDDGNGDDNDIDEEKKAPEDIELKGEIEDISNLNLDDDVFVCWAGGDSIIVGKEIGQDEFRYGAINTKGEQIIPFEYEGYQGANDYGYFVLMKDKDKDGEFGTNDLYSSKGEKIYSGPYMIVASNEAFVVAKQEKNSATAGGYDEDFKMEYYTYDKKLIASVDCTSLDGLRLKPNGFINGKSVVTKAEKVRGETYFYSKKYYVSQGGFYNYQVGYVSLDGTVKWEDGDGNDASDSSKFMTDKEVQEYMKTDSRIPAGSTYSVGEWDLMRPMNAPVEGYMMGIFDHEPTSIHYYLRDSKGYIISVSPWGMILGKNGDMDMNRGNNIDENDQICESGYGGAYMGTAGETVNRTAYYYYNGFYVANYGTKMVLRTDNKYILMDFKEDLDAVWQVFDYVDMSMEKNWLISKDGKWGYCDHDGKVVQLFDDAADFCHGYAVIIEDGTAYLINDKMEKLKPICEAESVINSGQVYKIKNGDKETYYYLQ